MNCLTLKIHQNFVRGIYFLGKFLFIWNFSSSYIPSVNTYPQGQWYIKYLVIYLHDNKKKTCLNRVCRSLILKHKTSLRTTYLNVKMNLHRRLMEIRFRILIETITRVFFSQTTVHLVSLKKKKKRQIIF